jgi:two-component system OmpR family response regulator
MQVQPSSSEAPRLFDRPGVAAEMTVKVFLVEDSPLLLDRLLEDLGSSERIEVIGYADTEALALSTLRDVNCDAVVLDLQLKEGSGLGVLQALRAKNANPRLQVIAFTNYASAFFRKQALHLGADFFFDKSRDYDRVCQVLDGLGASSA